MSVALVRPGIASGTLEAVKWLAFAGMLVDHVNGGLFGYQLGAWADVIGRPVMPLFVAVFAYNLTRPGQGAHLVTMAKRLAIAGAIAQPFHAWLFFPSIDVLPLNILWLFAGAALALHLVDRDRAWAAWLLAAAGCVLVEFSVGGVALVASAIAWQRNPTVVRLVGVAASLALVCVYNGNAWALLAAPLWLTAHLVRVDLPRSGRMLLWGYPAHLALLTIVALGV